MYSAADKTPVPELSQRSAAISALAKALQAATAAGQWETVAVIAKELSELARDQL